MVTLRSFARAGVVAAAALCVNTPAMLAQQKCPATSGATMPLKYRGGPTVAAITPCDLMTRLYIYADDSLEGRDAGKPSAMRATAYIEGQIRALGLKPAGDNGSYFMNMPVTTLEIERSSTITAAGATFHPGADFTTNAVGADRAVTGDVIYGGVLGDTMNLLAPDQVAGKIVVVKPAVRVGGGAAGFAGRGAPVAGGRPNPLAGAAAILTVSPNLPQLAGRPTLNDTVQSEGRAAYAAAHPAPAGGRGGRGGRGGPGAAGGGFNLTITPSVAAALLGKPVDQAAKGDQGVAGVAINVKSLVVPAPTRSVVGIIPGTDAKLRNEYVLIGAHSDHIGMNNRPEEHDSIKAYNEVAKVEGADSRGTPPLTDAQWARINALKDSLRKIYPARLDSISNGADDDGSGSVSILEIAEAFAKGKIKPKRSLIFIWQTGEEKGLWGSQWFTNHPTVPRDSIVADLNLDMVGRGEATDITGRSKDSVELSGANNYLQLVGSRRLSTEYGDLAESVNKTEKVPFKFDYSMDANGHPQNIYCRSDHANYARYGIPVIFFTTGGHADYHQVTDEPQYIRYEHMARVDQLVFDIAVKVADLDHPVTRDQPKPDSPFASCQQ